jgi:hypothetical protein
MCEYGSSKVSKVHYLAWKYFGDGDWFSVAEFCKATKLPQKDSFHFLGMLCGWDFFEKQKGKWRFKITSEGVNFAKNYFRKGGGAVSDRYSKGKETEQANATQM